MIGKCTYSEYNTKYGLMSYNDRKDYIAEYVSMSLNKRNFGGGFWLINVNYVLILIQKYKISEHLLWFNTFKKEPFIYCALMTFLKTTMPNTKFVFYSDGQQTESHNNSQKLRTVCLGHYLVTFVSFNLIFLLTVYERFHT